MMDLKDVEDVKIKEMLKLIPNNFPVTLEDLEEIYETDNKTN